MTTASAERPPKPTYPPFAGLPDIPALSELRSRPQWLAWDYVWKEKGAKWDKPPLNARTGGLGSTTERATWSTYEQAAARAAQDGLPGVGYVLSPDVDDSGIDLDKCRDPETGVLQAWAQVAVDFAETYTEISPSGRGLRFFVRGLVEGRKIDVAQVEIYTEGRYLTVTGRHVPGTPTEIRPAPRLVAYLQERADQFRAAQRIAADLAREAERKKADKRKAEAPRPEREQTTSERAAAGARERGPREGSDFWRSVNDRALANLSSWVPSVFPGARWQAGTGAYRVEQSDLGEGYEEDLSLHPDGIRDFGVGDMGDARDGARSPIDIVQDYLPASDATAAAMWLCERIGVSPESIGWKGGERPKSEAPRGGAERDHDEAQGPTPAAFHARLFTWIEPSNIPLRKWVLDRHLIRQFISVMASPGGYGKSSVVIADAIALATGRNLIGHQPHGQHRVLIWNGEDPIEEMQRRIIAACLHYGVNPEEIEGRLFVNSGRDDPITVATVERNGIRIAVPTVEAFKATLRANAIDAWFIDPFVSCHAVPENDNMMIDRVAKEWGSIAGQTDTAGELVHHTKKTGGAEVTMEDMRGAVALLSAARSGRILNGMTKDEAEKAGVSERRLHFRVDNGKANLAPPSEASSWFKMQSIPLGNGPPGLTDLGDSVGVVSAWEWPDPMKDLTTADLRAAQTEVLGCMAAGAKFRLNVQAKDWIGIPIARSLKVDISVRAEKSRVSRILKTWIETGMFAVVDGKDAKGMAREFVEVGILAND